MQTATTSHQILQIYSKRYLRSAFHSILDLVKNITTTLAVMGLIFAMTSVQAYADPRPLPWENWKTDFTKTSIDISEIISGGPPKDGIPAINDPKFVSIATAEKHMDGREPVLSLSIKGDHRAYPLGVFMRHEIANDVVGGKPVVVTYCPLCNSAIVFDAMIDGKRHDFGTTGRLRNSDLVMYDRQTESWWQQFTGKALIGHYVGRQLHVIPSRIESFLQFKKRFAKGRVMAGLGGRLDGYGNNPYTGYDTAQRPFLYNGEMPKGIDPMARVVVVNKGNSPLVITLDKIRKAKKLKMGEYEFSWKEGQASALDTSRIADGREVGNLVVQKASGDKKVDAIHEITFAFVAHAFMPEAKIIQ